MIKLKIGHLLWAALLLVLCLPALKALWAPGFYTSHDGYSHLSRLAQYTQNLREGNFPPRWGATLFGRVGYPVFVYAYHLPYILASVPYFLGFSLVDSLKILFGVAFLLSGIGTFYWLRQFFSAKASFVGALFFLYAPYRFILMYVRAAAGELLALSLLPFILLAATRLVKKPELSKIALLALSLGLGLSSHTLFLPMFLPLIVTYLFIIWIGKKAKGGVFFYSLLALLSGLALSAFSLLPVIFEREYIVFDQNYRGLAIGNLVEPWQLVRSPWGYGYSHQGTTEDAMSFQIGLAQLLVIVAFAGLLIISPLVKRFPRLFVAPLPSKALSVFMLVWFGIAIFLMVNIAPTRWIWQNLHFISVIDIPWRFLGITVLVGAYAAALIVEAVKPQWLVALLLVAAVLIANRNHLRTNQPVLFVDSYYQNDLGTTTFLNEYRPVWRQSNSIEPVEPRVLPLDPAEGKNFTLIENTGTKIQLQTRFTKPTWLQINVSYFPGWRIFLKNGNSWTEQLLGRDIKITNTTVAHWRQEDIDGTMQLSVPSGEQTLKVIFQKTPLRRVADLISLGALSLILILAATKLKSSWQVRL